jgi:hypothetical protein
MEPWLPLIGGALLSLLFLWGAVRSRAKRRLLEDTPTSKTAGVFIGFVELKGRARSGHPLRSFLAEADCVWYAWSVEEHWSRTVTESYTDAQGKRRTRTRTESGWTTVASGGEMIPFYVEDETGVLRVVPDGAKVEAASAFSETCGRGDGLYYGKGPAGGVSNSTHRRRFTESALPLGAALYVVGCARERKDVVAPQIQADPSAPLFLISTRDEAAVRRSYGRGSWGWATGGLVVLGAGVWIHAAMAQLRPEPIAVESALSGLGYLGAGSLGWGWMVYNSMVSMRHRVRQAWSLIDVQLKRRADLIPNLVSCVRGFADHERTLQAELAALRGQLEATPPGRPGPDPHELRSAVRVMVERYPDLKAQAGFLELQEELARTEERIALARAYYNDLASFYNVRRQVVPDAWVASLAGCGEERLLEADGFERAPVRIEF